MPYITTQEVSEFLQALDPTCSKATGIDGLGPRILKLRQIFWPHRLTPLSRKAFKLLQFRLILSQQKYFQYIKMIKIRPPISILPTISKIFEEHTK